MCWSEPLGLQANPPDKIACSPSHTGVNTKLRERQEQKATTCVYNPIAFTNRGNGQCEGRDMVGAVTVSSKKGLTEESLSEVQKVQTASHYGPSPRQFQFS